jgi:beta-glucosidase
LEDQWALLGRCSRPGTFGWVGSAVERPKRALKAFSKIYLEAGESKAVDFSILLDSLAYYDEGEGKWVVEEIPNEVYVGPYNGEDVLLSARV